MDLNSIKPFMFRFLLDRRISVGHLAIVIAIITLAKEDNAPVFISRRIVMKLAHIKSIVTYHKLIKELQKFGYIDYIPSYHPGIRSRVCFL